MKYGVLLFALGISFVAVGWQYPAGGPVFYWTATSFCCVGTAYVLKWPGVFGKRGDGTLAPVNALVLAPYLAMLWIVWRIACSVSREPAYHEVDKNFLIGRRLRTVEVPEDAEVIIDLTCEFNEVRMLRERRYFGCPLLDGTAPSPDQFDRWIDAAVRQSGVIYVHCAQGHGRTGLFAAAFLLKTERCQSVEDALRTLKSVRPKLKLNVLQQKSLEDFWRRAQGQTLHQ